MTNSNLVDPRFLPDKNQSADTFYQDHVLKVQVHVALWCHSAVSRVTYKITGALSGRAACSEHATSPNHRRRTRLPWQLSTPYRIPSHSANRVSLRFGATGFPFL